VDTRENRLSDNKLKTNVGGIIQKERYKALKLKRLP